MKKNSKLDYLAPELEILVIRNESIICGSDDGTYGTITDPDDYEDE